MGIKCGAKRENYSSHYVWQYSNGLSHTFFSSFLQVSCVS